MHVDFLTLACLRDDLDKLLGARVQQTVLVDELTVGLELYAARRRQYLTLSADARTARVTLAAERLRRGHDTETPLLLLLRKWVRGARLVDVTQPAWERMLVLDFAGAEGDCRLVAEIMDRYSNLVLVGPDGCVLDAAKRIGPRLNRRRVTLPGQPYQQPPPPVNREAPRGVDWERLLSDAPPDQPLHYALTGRLRGVSPTLAREIAARVTGDAAASASAASAGAMARAVAELLAPLDTGAWEPHLGMDEHGEVIAFAPYRLLQCPRSEPAPDASSAIERYLARHVTAPSDAYATARREVDAAISARARDIGLAIGQVTKQLPGTGEIEQLRENGELLLAYQHQVAAGADHVTVADHRGEPHRIDLDPQLTAVENARAFFQRYGKARRASEELPARLAELEADRAYLEQLAMDLAAAGTRPEIDAVRDALVAAGWLAEPRRPSAPMGGPKRVVVDGFVIYVGRNARQNEEITFKQAGPDDVWLHVRGRPGPHVIIKSGGQAVPECVVEQAAALATGCADDPHGDGQSRRQHAELRLPVDVTLRRFVRRMPGGRPGMVTYRNERTLWVAPCPPS